MAKDGLLDSSWSTLQAVYPTLPLREFLSNEREDAMAAQARGYYLPDEDERLREVYTTYLSARSALLEMIQQLRPRILDEDLRLFAVAYCAALALMRSAGYLVEIARDRPVVHKKLDEAEPRYGLPRKTFTKIYRNYTSPLTLWQFSQAKRYYEKNAEDIHSTLQSSGMHQLSVYLKKEEPFSINKKHSVWRTRLGYRWHSLYRRSHSGYVKVMFHLFRLSGSTIAGKRDPLQKARTQKKVTPDIVKQASAMLRPGDVIITRHDDALSNYFFPGFWPHAALYVGTRDQRKALKLPNVGTPEEVVLEAKKDGVKLRPLTETLSVDNFVVLRPVAEKTDLAQVLERSLSHEGKLYDFLFDFRKAERLACTEVIYRSFHGLGDWQLELVKQSGRLTLPAEELIRQSLDGGFAEVFAIFGAHGSDLLTGPPAVSVLEKTLGEH